MQATDIGMGLPPTTPGLMRRSGPWGISTPECTTTIILPPGKNNRRCTPDPVFRRGLQGGRVAQSAPHPETGRGSRGDAEEMKTMQMEN